MITLDVTYQQVILGKDYVIRFYGTSADDCDRQLIDFEGFFPFIPSMRGQLTYNF